MFCEIFNPTKDILYFDVESREMLPADRALFPKRINARDLDVALDNGLFILRKPGTYKPMAGVIPIPGRTRWLFDGESASFLKTLWYKKISDNVGLPRIERIVRSYIKFLEGKTVAVELSGGLDTALIIGLLQKFNVNLAFVGFNSSEYEFRTERAIQNYYLQYAEKSQIIDYAECNAFAGLIDTPIHPFPQADSLYHARHSMVASATRSLGADILLNGNAGDSLLGHGFAGHINGSVPDGYDPWSITDIWTVETIFKPLGINYLCPFALHSVIRAFISIRRNEPEDHMKLWARKVYGSILPYQLSRYAYKANHDCWVADGLRSAEGEIREVINTAYHVTKNSKLNSDDMVSIAKNYFHATTKEKHEFLIKLSFSVWVYGFVRDGLI